jgi:hypothetical protein
MYVRHGKAWDDMVWYGMCAMEWHGMMWYGTTWNGKVWYDMAWYDMVCTYIVLFDMVQYVWYNMVSHVRSAWY